MAVEILVFPDLDLRWIYFNGVLEVADLNEIKTRVYSGTHTISRSFVDMQDLTDVSVGFLNMLGTKDAATQNLRASRWQLRQACHAPTDLTFGIARIYHSLLSDSAEIEAFLTRDRQEALHWLGLDELPPKPRGPVRS